MVRGPWPSRWPGQLSKLRQGNRVREDGDARGGADFFLKGLGEPEHHSAGRSEATLPVAALLGAGSVHLQHPLLVLLRLCRPTLSA